VFTKYRTHVTYIDNKDIINISIILLSFLKHLISFNVLKYRYKTF